MTNIYFRLGTTLAIAFCSLISANAQSNYLQCAGTTVDRDKQTTVDIALKNDVDFTAFQCDITIPETVNFVDNEGIIKASPRLAESHRIIEKKLNDNTLRVIVYSTDNSAFSNDTETLFSYAISAVDPNEDSSSQTRISNIVFSQIDNGSDALNCIEHIFDDLTFNTSVSGIDAVNITELKIYASGMHIIVLSPSNTTLQLTTVAGITSTLNVKAGKNIFDVTEPGMYIVGTEKVLVQ
ncbi:MAG: hypothetical protein ACI30V_01185 [Muribaculaceae bacterium]